MVLYDPQTRSELQTSQPFPSKNNKRDKLIANADGSVDLYFGPKAPAGKEANWTQTVPGKGWFAIFRALRPAGAVVRQDVAAGRDRGGALTSDLHLALGEDLLEPRAESAATAREGFARLDDFFAVDRGAPQDFSPVVELELVGDLR